MNEPNEGAGYKRPPAHARFKPGQSGNPSGRPRLAQNFRTALQAELAKSIGSTTKQAALVSSLVDRAIAGNAQATAVLISALMRLAEADSNAPEIDDNDQALLDDYVDRQAKARVSTDE